MICVTSTESDWMLNSAIVTCRGFAPNPTQALRGDPQGPTPRPRGAHVCASLPHFVPSVASRYVAQSLPHSVRENVRIRLWPTVGYHNQS